jgi:hypothetical protein
MAFQKGFIGAELDTRRHFGFVLELSNLQGGIWMEVGHRGDNVISVYWSFI